MPHREGREEEAGQGQRGYMTPRHNFLTPERFVLTGKGISEITRKI